MSQDLCPVKSLEITEVTPTADTKDLLFTIISKFQDGSSGTVIRTHSHFVWINTKIGLSAKGIILPSLPEAANPALSGDLDHCEKKRRQYLRYITKLIARSETWKSEDLKTFFTAPVINVGEPQQDTLTIATGYLTTLASSYTNDNGLRIYKPTLVFDDLDETDFDKRKMYIFQSEKDHKVALDSIAALFRARSGMGRAFLQLGQQLSDVDSDKSFSGFLLPFNEFGIKVNGIHLEQVRNDVFHFGDIVLEYRNNANVKAFLNHRTDMLIEYDNMAKNHAKASENAEKLKKKLSENAPEVIAAFDERDKAKEALNKQQHSYESFRKEMKHEFNRFEETKSADFKEALGQFVQGQIQYEKKKLDCLNDLLAQLKSK